MASRAPKNLLIYAPYPSKKPRKSLHFRQISAFFQTWIATWISPGDILRIKTVLPEKMNPLRLQIAIIIGLWVVAEGWFASYWWSSKYFSRAFPSVGIPITAIAIVMIAWATLRYYVLKLAIDSGHKKVFGITLLLTASVMGGFAPHLIGQILAGSNIFRSSFHGEAGWPAFLCSISLWMVGAVYFIVGLVEIITTKPRHTRD